MRGTEPLDEVMELLVAECLNGGGVEAASPLAQGQEYGELPHDRLSRTGRSGNQDPGTVLDDRAAVALVGIQREGESARELREGGAGLGDERCRGVVLPPTHALPPR